MKKVERLQTIARNVIRECIPDKYGNKHEFNKIKKNMNYFLMILKETFIIIKHFDRV